MLFFANWIQDALHLALADINALLTVRLDRDYAVITDSRIENSKIRSSFLENKKRLLSTALRLPQCELEGKHVCQRPRDTRSRTAPPLEDTINGGTALGAFPSAR